MYICILIVVGSSREIPARRAATATATQGGRAATQRQGQTKGPNDASERANDSFHFRQQWGTKDQVVYHTVVQSPDTCICILWHYSRQVIFTIYMLCTLLGPRLHVDPCMQWRSLLEISGGDSDEEDRSNITILWLFTNKMV